ncbi:MAG: hypothetical protein JWO06_3305 [Bacteroidota bacterium]|nr:hypothetical protein [Bacteroidota bacterium]
MKLLRFSIVCLVATIALFVAGCTKTGCTNPAASNYDSSAKKDNGKCQIVGCTDPAAHNYNSAANSNSGCVYYGKATFWFNSNMGSGSINAIVNVGDSVAHITQFFNSAPGCGTVGCANFNLPAGRYFYGASFQLSTWNDSITIVKDSCIQILLQP